MFELFTHAAVLALGILLGFMASRYLIKRDPERLERLYREAKKAADRIRS